VKLCVLFILFEFYFILFSGIILFMSHFDFMIRISLSLSPVSPNCHHIF